MIIALIVFAILAIVFTVLCIRGFSESLLGTLEEIERGPLESCDTKRTAPGAGSKTAALLLLFLFACGVPVASGADPVPPIAAAEAPEGLGSFAASGLYVMGAVIAVLQVVSLIRGLKVQQPLTVTESDKFPSASAFSRHCVKQDADLEKIRNAHAELEREFAEVAARYEHVSRQLETIQSDIKDILQRLPRK